MSAGYLTLRMSEGLVIQYHNELERWRLTCQFPTSISIDQMSKISVHTRWKSTKSLQLLSNFSVTAETAYILRSC